MNIWVANTWRERIRGLLGRDGIAPGDALLITGCWSVHTFGMRFPIRVAFLDAGGRVIEVIEMAPNRICLPRLRARHVLEFGVDTPAPTWVPDPRAIASRYT